MSPSRPEVPGTIGVLVADSNRMQMQLLAAALRRHHEFRVVTCQLDPVSILHAVSSRVVKVALLAVNSARAGESMATLHQFHLAHPEIAKVVLVEACHRQLVVSALRSDARGIFSVAKAGLRDLSKCIQRVAAGQVWVNTEQMNYLLDLITEVPSLRVLNAGGNALLTPREEQVVALVAEGMGNRDIAHELRLSEHTVKKYLFRVFEKLGISSRVELVLYAMKNSAPRTAEWITGLSPAAREIQGF